MCPECKRLATRSAVVAYLVRLDPPEDGVGARPTERRRIVRFELAHDFERSAFPLSPKRLHDQIVRPDLAATSDSTSNVSANARGESLVARGQRTGRRRRRPPRQIASI